MNDELVKLILQNQRAVLTAFLTLQPMVGLPYERNLPLREAIEKTDIALAGPLTSAETS